jgi:hypothetical protein
MNQIPEAVYCIDTNAIISFIKETDDEYYGKDIFGEQWKQIEELMSEGLVVAPKSVKAELEKWANSTPELKQWLKDRKAIFVDVDSNQLDSAKIVLAQFDAYSKNENYANDLSVIALAHAKNLVVITLEKKHPQMSDAKPKIPNVCERVGVKCTSIVGLLRLEKIRGQIA